jgi:16S rRNA (cytidine1402-2'-O)-methyltransferase
VSTPPAAPGPAGGTPATLYLIPNLLGVVAPQAVLPARTIEVARQLTHFVVETPKAARAFLATLGMPIPIAQLTISALPERATPADGATLLAPARAGHAIGLVSDAGCPAVADPGAIVVAAAHRAGIRVVPLVGPCALLLALMASGLDGQRFAFHGYLPQKADARVAALRALEADSQAHARTAIFIETPYRNEAMLDAIAATLKPTTRVCVAADLTLASESIVMRAAREWRGRTAGAYAKRPAIFLLQA